MWKEAQRELRERQSSIKIVLESTKSENCYIRSKGEELESCKAQVQVTREKHLPAKVGMAVVSFQIKVSPGSVVPITYSE